MILLELRERRPSSLLLLAGAFHVVLTRASRPGETVKSDGVASIAVQPRAGALVLEKPRLTRAKQETANPCGEQDFERCCPTGVNNYMNMDEGCHCVCSSLVEEETSPLQRSPSPREHLEDFSSPLGGSRSEPLLSPSSVGSLHSSRSLGSLHSSRSLGSLHSSSSVGSLHEPLLPPSRTVGSLGEQPLSHGPYVPPTPIIPRVDSKTSLEDEEQRRTQESIGGLGRSRSFPEPRERGSPEELGPPSLRTSYSMGARPLSTSLSVGRQELSPSLQLRPHEREPLLPQEEPTPGQIGRPMGRSNSLPDLGRPGMREPREELSRSYSTGARPLSRPLSEGAGLDLPPRTQSPSGLRDYMTHQDHREMLSERETDDRRGRFHEQTVMTDRDREDMQRRLRQYSGLETPPQEGAIVVLETGEFAKVLENVPGAKVKVLRETNHVGEQDPPAEDALFGQDEERELEVPLDQIVDTRLLEEAPGIEAAVHDSAFGVGSHDAHVRVPNIEDQIPHLALEKPEKRKFEVDLDLMLHGGKQRTALKWTELRVKRRPPVAENDFNKLANLRRADVKKQNAQDKAVFHESLSTAFKEHLGMEGEDFPDGLDVVVLRAPAGKDELVNEIGQVKGDAWNPFGQNVYTVEMKSGPEGVVGQTEMLEESMIFPFLPVPNEPGVSREGELVRITRTRPETSRITEEQWELPVQGKKAVITHAHWEKLGSNHEGEWVYTATAELTSQEGSHKEEVVLDLMEDDFEAVDLLDPDQMERQKARVQNHYNAAFKGFNRWQKKKSKVMSESERQVYENLLRDHADKAFPDDVAITAHMQRFRSGDKRMQIGKRHKILKDMIDGLIPTVAKARMLAGADDQFQGMEANVNEWAKEGLTVLGSARGEKKLAKVVLDHFQHAHQTAYRNGHFRQEQIENVAKGLDDVGRAVPNFGPGAPNGFIKP